MIAVGEQAVRCRCGSRRVSASLRGGSCLVTYRCLDCRTQSRRWLTSCTHAPGNTVPLDDVFIPQPPCQVCGEPSTLVWRTKRLRGEWCDEHAHLAGTDAFPATQPPPPAPRAVPPESAGDGHAPHDAEQLGIDGWWPR